MSTKAQIEKDLNAAMRASDELRKRTLRMTLTSIKLAEVDKGMPLEEAGIIAILQKEIKSRRETIADAERAKRPEMVADAQAEIDVLESYLPKQLSQAEIEDMARQVIAETGATSQKEMGQVMKILMARLQGQAEGSQVSQIVRQLLG